MHTSIRRIGQSSSIVPGPLNYTTAEFGQVIRKHVRLEDGAMLAENDLSLPLWHYADRAIKKRIWDPTAFEGRLHDQRADLCFEISERWRGKVSAVLIPRAYLGKGLEPLAAYLDSRYARHDEQNFVVFDLTKPASR
jgi:hypothetical protein